MKIKRYATFIFITISVLFIFSGCSAPAEPTAPLVKIMVAVPDGAAVESANPVYVASGGTAQFDLKISDGFKLENIETLSSSVSVLTGESERGSLGGAVYENGSLVIENARYPSTIRLDVRPLKTYRYFIENNLKMGVAVSDAEQGRIPEDTFINLSVAPVEDCIFIGWSKGAPMSKGGQFLSASPEYSFSLVSDTFIYPNYLSKNSVYVKYNANGGTVKGGSDEDTAGTLYYEVNTKIYPIPNAYGDTGLLSREGYALLEYNTAPDGSGTAVGLGANINVPPSGENIIELFAQWVKYTDVSMFTYTEANEKITITGYKGNEEMVVIPEFIDGLPVTALVNGAIKGQNLKTLFVTKNIGSIAVRAISDCRDLETIYISDSVTRMQNESISGCRNLANFYINAVIAPRYFTSLGWGNAIKYKWLLTAPGKRLFVISGSSSAFGLNSPVLTQLLDNEYSIVNYGTHAGACSLFFLEFIANQVREGDIVLMAPEPVWDSQQGSNWLDPLVFQILEGAYEAFRHVDIRNFTNVYASFSAYNATRSRMGAETYEDFSYDVNINGDMLTNQADHPVDYVAGGQWITYNNLMDTTGAARFNRIHDIVQSRGGRMYMSCSPVNRNALIEDAATEKKQSAYIEHIRRLLDFPVISVPGDYIFPGNYFSDTDHHLNDVHSADRSVQLAKDLKAQFESERQ